MKTILLGAVAYDPKVVGIWDIIRDYSNEYGCKLDYVLFSNYERQVDSLLKGHIDIAWNTNVAWIRTLNATDNKAKAIAMRDTDMAWTTKFIAKKDSKINSLEDLKGKRVGVGSADSSQANIMAIYYLNKNGLKIKESNINNSEVDNECVNIIRYNSDLGKHGDTGKSEWDVLEGIKNGSLDAGTIGSNTWIRILEEGLYPDGELVSFYTSPEFCHCNFSVMPNTDAEISNNFVGMLMSQKKENPIIKKMMAMEGLNEWIITGEKELKGYDTLYEAMREQKLL
ncbi:phosphate/phosphite/phosphonate ABC transporter substrate-binding protein [Brachyspira catarrhinii]|uniref:Transporter substrate-binding domain-containing protein n=1 Tax=Brachyspira catarrhinii TaxID=2528966 RepID=A0ABY2TS15_9SPIR|nr:PhnD/SsuA/transferrin family substrate-binding protein [Brachyspira catarrhinii]TKZ35228.1 transporter substrate-binding domain-containing protein [Brachyspira catarrhinii]